MKHKKESERQGGKGHGEVSTCLVQGELHKKVVMLYTALTTLCYRCPQPSRSADLPLQSSQTTLLQVPREQQGGWFAHVHTSNNDKTGNNSPKSSPGEHTYSESQLHGKILAPLPGK